MKSSAGIVSKDGLTLTVRIPLTLRKFGGRKLVVAPDGEPSWAKPPTRIDNTMVKALARAFRWRRLLETGVYASVEDISRAEKLNTSYISRILRLTLLAPGIIELILNGRQPVHLSMASLTKPFPLEWKAQRQQFLEG